MLGVLLDADAVLRGRLAGGLDDRPGYRGWWRPVRVVLVFAPLVGLASGSYSVDSPDRAALMVFSAVKMPLLVLVTAALCVPGFFCLHAALGVRDHFAGSMRGVLTGQAVFAVVLAAMSPLIVVWYSVVGANKEAAILGVGAVFAFATLVSLAGVRRALRGRFSGGAAQRAILVGWFVMYGFVGIQLGWMLRPFVGSPELAPAFVREDPFTNGYVVVFRMLAGS